MVCFALALPLAPPSLFAQDYLLFATDWDYGCHIIQMDSEGNMSLREEHPVGWNSHHIVASPDGRTVVVSSCTTPTLSLFFIRNDGTIAPPQALSPSLGDGDNPVAFNTDQPYFYAGDYPRIASFRYDSQARSVEQTTFSMSFPCESMNIGYSPWAQTLLFLTAKKTVYDIMQAVHLGPDGEFGAVVPPFALPALALDDLAVSPDGRWAATVGYNDPGLMLLRVAQDGSLSLADQISFPSGEVGGAKFLRFTPDSRRLLLLSRGQRALTLYDLDPDTGLLTERDVIPLRVTPDYAFMNPEDLALTPDGRYAAFRTFDVPPDYNHTYIHLVRIHEEGRLEYLPDKRFWLAPFVNALAFTTLPPKNAAGREWTLYQ